MGGPRKGSGLSLLGVKGFAVSAVVVNVNSVTFAGRPFQPSSSFVEWGLRMGFDRSIFVNVAF